MPGVTKEQIQEAREADLFRYLQFHEPGVLKRDGPNYRHKEHDSLVYVTGKRYWYWNSRGRSINALDYLVEIRGYGLVDAVNTLTDGGTRQTENYRSAAAKSHVHKEPEKKHFSASHDKTVHGLLIQILFLALPLTSVPSISAKQHCSNYFSCNDTVTACQQVIPPTGC